jgi:hypothetical protein
MQLTDENFAEALSEAAARLRPKPPIAEDQEPELQPAGAGPELGLAPQGQVYGERQRTNDDFGDDELDHARLLARVRGIAESADVSPCPPAHTSTPDQCGLEFDGAQA